MNDEEIYEQGVLVTKFFVAQKNDIIDIEKSINKFCADNNITSASMPEVKVIQLNQYVEEHYIVVLTYFPLIKAKQKKQTQKDVIINLWRNYKGVHDDVRKVYDLMEKKLKAKGITVSRTRIRSVVSGYENDK